MTDALLIEIGVEELPAVPLLKIVTNIEESWRNILGEYSLSCDFEFIYTPRRLVLKHAAMPLYQADSTIEHFGPPVEAALKEGEPTQAALGFAKKCGVAFELLGRGEKGGKEVLYFKQEEKGAPTASLLQAMLENWLASMAFGKMMRWGSRADEFIRPLRWLQVRLGEAVVPMELFGVKSDSKTYVHRMLSYEAIAVPTLQSFEEILSEGAVMLYPKDREAKILVEFDALEAQHGIIIERDEELLAEVVAITENPKALLGSFDEGFLALPPEVIITSMKEHQRYFPVFEHGKITNKFVVVSNAYTDDYTKVIAGNERVLKPRLADALFFYTNDLKNGLRTDGLEKVQFIDGLGTLSDKIKREKNIAIRLLALYMDKVEQETGKSSVTLEKAMDRAVGLAKADLMSEMVYEFTELQGLMGYYYAKALGEEELVFNAIKEQYMPVGEGAELPHSVFSAIVAMSIKLDTLFGLFSVGKIPTGSKDPFALRRAVNGVVRIVTAYDLPFNIDDVITLLKGSYEAFDTMLLSEFIVERINKSLPANPSVIAAVLASGERDINEIAKKVTALNTIVCADTFKEQFSTFKRVANISKEVDLDSDLSIDVTLFKEEAEVVLYTAYEKVINASYHSYKEELEALFGLKRELDTYFDDVMVNAEELDTRANRLNTIASIYKTFKSIADIKEITV
ncbi:MAG TPA: glycine--tRNA ligase subunit beta [Sulfurovum sp.]|jgi:glycyl-tRNA synthetase beta chain|nr:MAG: glycine--tRNA ligase subunit beta [Sulfurovum sp. 35-42-20]OYZ26015.1 MAG: glycine--tRNA ligase subunit beta [Sulfurovum sp. 16-42-52]OYZ50405.1 MAG: glycine--tRNA ligase subunit beta [Sulfurovum sp. 24-42-9]OZA46049.1 MAG: glycine--tRNA ligase subunit beta [Sulfurovum sp. 17-42-90]OZA60292.1 MAG: glycine--tRNA ligase subunit beta [Sulfurovum sp. 39-42-12]HQR73393.1 glycine--tRNA ligase subunit beta [Sulfurovum sp.]